MMSEHFIEEKSLSVAWAKAVGIAGAKGRKEFSPLVVSINGFDDGGNVEETSEIRSLIDEVLTKSGKQTVETVAGTIFPYSMWNPEASRDQLFARYVKSLPRLKSASSKNKHGIYFERMVTGGPASEPNQLKFMLDAFTARKSVRRSMMQICIWNPTVDLTTAAMRGFPCLQHVTFAPTKQGLNVNAFYATQYMVERGYGNYLGICRLGQFVASELGVDLARVTVFSGIAQIDASRKVLSPIIDFLKKR